MREFIHEFVGHYVALEGPLWRTLWAMLFLPGRPTREYFIGRRRRYVQPLRLYLSLSLVFFIAVHLLPGDHMLTVKRDEQTRAQARQGSCSSPGSTSCSWWSAASTTPASVWPAAPSRRCRSAWTSSPPTRCC